MPVEPREAMIADLVALKKELGEGWNTDTALAHLVRVIDDADRRYEQRFSDSKEAVNTALIAQEKAVAAALAAAEKAVQKAEVAAEKRFDSVNEFRAQLADQATSFISRTEADARINSVADRSELQISQLQALVGSMGSRLDKAEGHSGGINAGWAYLMGAIGTMVGLAGILLAILHT